MKKLLLVGLVLSLVWVLGPAEAEPRRKVRGTNPHRRKAAREVIKARKEERSGTPSSLRTPEILMEKKRWKGLKMRLKNWGAKRY